MFDVTVIGCGVIGASIAYELSHYQLSVAIVEKENDIACGATKANSAIVHAGYDPMPGTKMARLNVEGSKKMEDLCKRLSVEYKRIGSLVLAFDEADLDIIRGLYRRGILNGVEELQMLSKEQALNKEPNLNPKIVGALYAPTTAVVNPWGLAIAMAQSAVANGTKLYLNGCVSHIIEQDGFYQLKAGRNTLETKYIVNASGAFSDTVNNMAAKPYFTILPVKGQYYLLDKSQGEIVNHVIFQPPSRNGKGVLISPTVHGNLIVGPTADPAASSEDTAVTADGLEEVVAAATRSSAKINFRESIRNFAGLRATTETDDFILEAPKDAPRFVNAAAIKSPGLSASPAIGPEVRGILEKNGLICKKKTFYTDFQKRPLFRDMTENQRKEALLKNPLYGRVICRCETITEGDILHVIQSPIPPVSIDGIKRRCNAGMGRCQGGFCGPRVHTILSRETGVPMEKIEQDRAGSCLLTGETKTGGDQFAK